MKKSLVAVATALILPLSVQAAPLDNQQKQEVKQLVREALMENPEILVEVINELKKKEQQQQAQVQGSALQSSHQELFNDSADPFVGPANAKVSLVYFGDMNCGYCKKQDPVLGNIASKYPNVKIIYKDLPILKPSSREAAAVALAAHQQNATTYITLHKRLMSNTSALTSDSIAQAAKETGLDFEKLKKAITPEINAQLDGNIRLAQKLGIRGTPALVFQDEVLGGYTDETALIAAIEKRLKQK